MVDLLNSILGSIVDIIFLTWWVILPVVLVFVFWDVWMVYIRTRFIKEKLSWVLLEIKVPKEVLKTPKAMEQIFTGVYSSYSYGLSFVGKYWEGEVEPWFSFEIVGFDGAAHFLVRTLKDYRNLIESAVYAQYPDAEINEIEDYFNLLPKELPNKDYDLWGTEMVLGRDSVYPLRTYFYFEESVEEQRIDPVAAIIEVMAGLKEGEMVIIQVMISPTGGATGNDWKEEAESVINKIMGRKVVEKKPSAIAGYFYAVGEFFHNLVLAVWRFPVWSGGEGGEEKEKVIFETKTPGETDIMKAVENKISKLGFNGFLRFVYVDRRDSFTGLNVSAIMGAFHQFNTQNMNFLKPNKTITVYGKLPGKIFPFYKKIMLNYKKRRLFRRCRERRFGDYNLVRDEKFSVFNTEELSTIYHFPIKGVESPSLRRVEAKKGEPPSTLPKK